MHLLILREFHHTQLKLELLHDIMELRKNEKVGFFLP